MRLFYLASLLTILSIPMQAQYGTVVFNFEKSSFNGGEALPAEKKFMITGSVPGDVNLVEVDLFNPKGEFEDPLFTARWKRPFDNTSNTFYLPVDYKLRSNDRYDFAIRYYKEQGQPGKEELLERLSSDLENFLFQSVELRGGKLTLRSSQSKVKEGVNALVEKSLERYRDGLGQAFNGFSVLVDQAIEDLNRSKVKRGLSVSDSLDSKSVKAANQVSQVANLMRTEIDRYLDQRIYYVWEEKRVPLYPTEKTRNVIALNAGYGGVYLKGGVNEISYGTAPYAGISLPLGNKAFRGSFWSNMSLSMGVFVQNFEGEDEQVITGPIIGRPFYGGFGYKFLRFMRFNAGAVLLETESSSSSSVLSVGQVQVRPFIGLGVEINIWMGIDR